MRSNQGYAAFTSVLVIAAATVVLATGAAIMAVEEARTSRYYKQAEQLRYTVEACAEDALLTLNETNVLPASFTVAGTSCTITLNSQVGTVWNLTVSTTSGGHARSLVIQADRNGTIEIAQWNQQ